MNGKFIVMEGLDGSGKTTILEMLKERLPTSVKERSTFVREPAGTPLADSLRTILLSVKASEINQIANLLLFCASRADLTEKVILPALEAGGVVFSDRYVPSTFAYQGYGTQVSLSLLHTLNDVSSYGLADEMNVIYLDISPYQRQTRIEQVDARDKEDTTFYDRVRAGYYHAGSYYNLSLETPRWHLVNADKSLDEVYEEVERIVLSIIND